VSKHSHLTKTKITRHGGKMKFSTMFNFISLSKMIF